METTKRRILGSAEPLTDAERAVRLRERADWGVDLSLIWAGLDKSPTQRLEEWVTFQAFAADLRRAMEASQADPLAQASSDVEQAAPTFKTI